jgi:WhiB family redox-sensing transcriptional regulator
MGHAGVETLVTGINDFDLDTAYDEADTSQAALEAATDAFLAEAAERAELIAKAELLTAEQAARKLGAGAIVLPIEEEDLSWKDRGLCAQTDPEAFFPEKGGSTREAKRVCTDCTVRIECLNYALDKDERFGIWGGLSERERRRLKKASL